MRKSERGHVFTELYIMVAFLGITAALLTPRFVQMRQSLGLHQCALALDSGASNAVCPKTGAALEIAPETKERCCPNPLAHGLAVTASLCEKPGDPPLATLYPGPSNAKRIFLNVAMAIVGGVCVIVFTTIFGAMLIEFIKSPKAFWAAMNRRGF